MAQETLAMSAVSSPDAFTLGAGASKVAAVAQPDDNDTSYITSAINNTEQRFTVTAPAHIGATDPINFVRLVIVAVSTGSLSSFRSGTAVGANTALSAVQGNVPLFYTTYQHDYALAPDGAAWTLTKLNSLAARLLMAANRTLRVTTFYAIVDYTPPGALARDDGQKMTGGFSDLTGGMA